MILKPLSILFTLNKILIKLERFLLSALLITMLFFASLQVFLRNFFDTGIEWADVFARHLVLWVGFFGATLATQDNRHIRIDALTKVISKKWQPLIEVFITIFCIIVSYLLAMAALKFTLDEKMAETVLFEGIPTWYFIAIMPIGFGLISFRLVIKLIEILLNFGGKKVEDVYETDDDSEIDFSVNIKLNKHKNKQHS